MPKISIEIEADPWPHPYKVTWNEDDSNYVMISQLDPYDLNNMVWDWIQRVYREVGKENPFYCR